MTFVELVRQELLERALPELKDADVRTYLDEVNASCKEDPNKGMCKWDRGHGWYFVWVYPNGKVQFEPSRKAYRRSDGQFVAAVIDRKKKRVWFKSARPLADPRIVPLIRVLAKYFPSHRISNAPGTIRQAASAIRTVKFKAPVYSPHGDSEYEEFEHDVIQRAADFTFYHATRASHLPSIMRGGLMPSGSSDQGTGWTRHNVHLQNAVYLTIDKSYASDIAATLADRFGEEAVVIKVRRGSIKDPSKLVVDEDELRDAYDGLMRAGDRRIPTFLQSLLGEYKGLGYRGVISPSALSVFKRVQPNDPDDED